MLLPKVKKKLGVVAFRLMALISAAFIVGLAFVSAWGIALLIETSSVRAIQERLLEAGVSWVKVEANGLDLRLSGTAPDEAERFRVVNLAGSVVQFARIQDLTEVTPYKAFEPPRFSVEILRNGDDIQLVGLVPEKSEAKKLLRETKGLSKNAHISDMIEVAAHPAPPNWQESLNYGVEALHLLTHSKISISAESVDIRAIANSAAEQQRFKDELTKIMPDGVVANVTISAPRPVLTPFILRLVKNDAEIYFDACSADSDEAVLKITKEARNAGVQGEINCTIGLGVPSPSWADAVVAVIETVNKLPEAVATFSDVDISFVAGENVSQPLFDRVIGELENALPDVFSLTARKERSLSSADENQFEFLAEIQQDGKVFLRGRLNSDMQRQVVEGVAEALWGKQNIYVATRQETGLPKEWSLRVLAGLEALAELDEGNLTVTVDDIQISGVSRQKAANERMSHILLQKLGEGEVFEVNAHYEAMVELETLSLDPRECYAQLQAKASKQKIIFDAGKTRISGKTVRLINDIVNIIRECPDMKLEIAGYTDNQGSDEDNLKLSQARADSILSAIRFRGVDTHGITAKGYGETSPIADNSTEEGREANRRIEFKLLNVEPEPEGEPVQPKQVTLPKAQENVPDAQDKAPKTSAPASLTQ